MILYSDGQPVQLGDVVDFDGEPGTVIDIAETPEDFTALGIDEPVIGFLTNTHPVIYQSSADLGWDSVVLVRRHFVE